MSAQRLLCIRGNAGKTIETHEEQRKLTEKGKFCTFTQYAEDEVTAEKVMVTHNSCRSC